MQDGYHNGKGGLQAAFERMKQNPLFAPHIAAYMELMTGTPNRDEMMKRLKVNSQNHKLDAIFDGGLNYETYMAAAERAMDDMLAIFIIIEQGTPLSFKLPSRDG